MILQNQIKRIIDSFEVFQSYLKDVKISGMTIETLLDRLLKSLQDVSASDFDHPHAHVQLLSECEFYYDLDRSPNLGMSNTAGDFEFDVKKRKWF